MISLRKENSRLRNENSRLREENSSLKEERHQFSMTVSKLTKVGRRKKLGGGRVYIEGGRGGGGGERERERERERESHTHTSQLCCSAD